jgi:hypothetical protein
MVPDMRTHFERFRNGLGGNEDQVDGELIQHMNKQLQQKGITRVAGSVMTYSTVHEATGTRAVLTFSTSSPTDKTARLVDVEIHAPLISSAVPVIRQQFSIKEVDQQDVDDVAALCMALEDRSLQLKNQISILKQLKASDRVLAIHQDKIHNVEQHLQSLEAHHESLIGQNSAIGAPVAAVRSAVSFSTKDLYTQDNIGSTYSDYVTKNALNSGALERIIDGQGAALKQIEDESLELKQTQQAGTGFFSRRKGAVRLWAKGKNKENAKTNLKDLADAIEKAQGWASPELAARLQLLLNKAKEYNQGDFEHLPADAVAAQIGQW